MIAFRGWLAFPRWDPVWTPGQSWKDFGKRVSAKRCGLLGHNNLIGARSGFFACCFLGFAGTLWAKQRTWFSSSAGCGQSGEVHRAEGLLVLLSRRRFVCLPVCYFWINGFFYCCHDKRVVSSFCLRVLKILQKFSSYITALQKTRVNFDIFFRKIFLNLNDAVLYREFLLILQEFVR